MADAVTDQATIRTALAAARCGGASVPQLAVAHELSEKHGLHNTTAEIRTHLRNLIPDPSNHPIAVAKSLALGVSAGILTHFLLRLSRLRGRGAA